MRWFKNRKYKSGSWFALWRWTDVDSKYIVRLHLVKTPLFAICLHWILKPDPEPYLHDHPVTFLSMVLRGSYLEKRERWSNEHFLRGWFPRHRWFNWIRASRNDRHTIIEVEPGTLTLCLMGPKTREWGFHNVELVDGIPTTKLGSWLHWKDYHHALRALRAVGYRNYHAQRAGMILPPEARAEVAS